MSSKKKGSSGPSGGRGKRYTHAEKQKVINFVQEYNAKHGRGGQSQAAKKFGISVLTVSSWLRSAVVGKSAGAETGKKTPPLDGALKKKIADLIKVGDELRKLENEAAKLRAEYERIRSSILGDL